MVKKFWILVTALLIGLTHCSEPVDDGDSDTGLTPQYSITVMSPENGATVGGTVYFQGTLFPSSQWTVYISADGQFTTNFPASGITWSAVINYNTGGIVTNQIWAISEEKGTPIIYHYLNVALSPPSFNISGYTNNQEVGNNFQITGTISDEDSTVFNAFIIDDGVPSTGSVNGNQFSFNITETQLGSHTYLIYVVDSSGLSSPTQTLVLQRAVVPSINIAVPNSGYVTTNQFVIAQGTASIDAPYTITTVEVQVNGGSYSPASGTANWTYTIPLNPGTNIMRARAVSDNAKVTTSPEVYMIRNDTLPGGGETNTNQAMGRPVYVSKMNGNDNNNGYISSPVATLSKALEIVWNEPVNAIYVEEGSYSQGNGLTMPATLNSVSNFTLSGGWNSAFNMQTGHSAIFGNGSSPAMEIGSVNSLTINHFIFTEGFGAYGGGGLKIQDANQLTVTNCLMINNTADRDYGGGGGLYLNRVNNSTIHAYVVSNASIGRYGRGGGVSVEDSHYNTFLFTLMSNSTFGTYDNDGAGISIEQSTYNTILIDATFNECSGEGSGVYMTFGCTNNTVNGTIAYNGINGQSENAVYVGNSFSNTYNVDLHNNYGAGLFLSSANHTTINGTIYHQTGYGISYQDCDNITVTGNITNNQSTGIRGINGTGITIDATFIRNNQGTGWGGGGVDLNNIDHITIMAEMRENYSANGKGAICLSSCSNITVSGKYVNNFSTHDFRKATGFLYTEDSHGLTVKNAVVTNMPGEAMLVTVNSPAMNGLMISNCIFGGTNQPTAYAVYGYSTINNLIVKDNGFLIETVDNLFGIQSGISTASIMDMNNPAYLGAVAASGNYIRLNDGTIPGYDVFVSVSSGNDANSGLSESTPVKSLQRGIAVATAYGIPNVCVEEGIYTPANGGLTNTAEYGALIQNVSGISLYGGYNASFSSQTGKSVLSTESTGTPDKPMKILGTSGSYNRNIVLNGFVFTGGDVASGYGGALDAQYVSNLTITNCIFTNNYSVGTAGGAISIRDGKKVNISAYICDNTIGSYGGAIYFGSVSGINVSGSIMTNVHSADIVYFFGTTSDVTIQNCIFGGDNASGIGNCIAIFEDGNPSGLNLTGNLFLQNKLQYYYLDDVNGMTKLIANLNNATWLGATTANNNNEVTGTVFDKIFVSPTGDDANDGFINPVRTIQVGIEIAKDLGYDTVYVEQGNYTPGAGLSNATAGNRYAGLNVTNDNLTIIGGWNATFDAKVGYSVLQGNGAGNPYHVVYLKQKTGLTLTGIWLEGFVITGGYADGTSPDNSGAGIRIEYGDNIIITNCVISNNHSIGLGSTGGGIDMISCDNCKVVDSIIAKNSAYQGGGIQMAISDSDLIDAVIYDNTATNGGGFYSYFCRFITNLSLISNNRAELGAGAYMFTNFNSVMNAEFILNKAVGNNPWGGGLHLSKGGTNYIGGTFTTNTAVKGGGCYVDRSDANVFSGIFQYNAANLFGGGIAVVESRSNRITGTFLYNDTTNTGAAIDLTSSTNMYIDATVGYNNASIGGAGILIGLCSGIEIHGSYYSNTVGNFGGAMYFTESDNNDITADIFGNTSGNNGAGIQFYHSDNNTVNQPSSFSYNIASGLGGAVFNGNGCSGNTTSGSITYNGNSPDDWYDQP